MAWRGPQFDEEDPKEGDLPTLITIFNLHGDALENRLQLQLVCKYSAVLVVFAQTQDLLEKVLEKNCLEGQSILAVTHFEVKDNPKFRDVLQGRILIVHPIKAISDAFYEEI